MSRDAGSLKSMIGTLAIAAGVGWLGAVALDLHKHTCDNPNCKHTWRHLGVFNIGDEAAHTCPKCGQVQWWKDSVTDGALRRNMHRMHAPHEHKPEDS